MVEFALVAAPLFLILFGIIQLGYLFGGQNGLSNAAREAARYASTLPTPSTSVATANRMLVLDRLTNVNLRQYIAGFRTGNLVTGVTDTRVEYCRRPVASRYTVHVRVHVAYRHPLFIPLVGRLFSSTDTWQLGAVEEMRVEGPDRSNASSTGFATC